MDRREEAASLFQRVLDMGKKLDYEDKLAPETYVDHLENKFVSHSFQHLLDKYDRRILDIYGDGNCLYYCLLFYLQVHGMHPDPQNIGKINSTKILINKLRQQLQKFYNDYYDTEVNFRNLEDAVAVVNALTENEFCKRKILTDFAAYQGSKYFATEQRYDDGDFLGVAIQGTRILYDDLVFETTGIYQENFMYIRWNPKANYKWYNDHKLSKKAIKNRQEKQPPFPDGYFII